MHKHLKLISSRERIRLLLEYSALARKLLAREAARVQAKRESEEN